MNTNTLGEPRFASTFSHTISDDVRIPERIEIGAEPGIKFELAGPRAKLFFDPKQTRAGIVTCGGLCPGLNNVIRLLRLRPRGIVCILLRFCSRFQCFCKAAGNASIHG